MLTAVLIFVLLFGLCVGSFLNVVVYRLPLGKSLVHPPSTCPKCNTRLAWHDNVPVLGWIWLGGKCRTCKLPISPRYPLVEAATGLLFLGYAVAIFYWGWGPCVPAGGPRFSPFGLPLPPLMPNILTDWPILVIHLLLLGVLIASSLIDLETFTIPASLPITAAVVGLAGHALLMTPRTLGNLSVSETLALPALLAGLGYVVSVGLFWVRVIPMSFPKGEPMMLDHTEWQAEMDAAKAEGREPEVPLEPPVRWTRGMLNREMMKEVLFMTPPILGFVVGLIWNMYVPGWGASIAKTPYLNTFLGAVLGGLVGGGVIWTIRILGTMGFGKLAMGLGDIHLMAAVGTVTGGTVATAAVFLAAPYALLITLYSIITRKTREIPFGPYLALGTLTAMLMACLLQHYFLDAFTAITAPLPPLPPVTPVQPGM